MSLLSENIKYIQKEVKVKEYLAHDLSLENIQQSCHVAILVRDVFQVYHLKSRLETRCLTLTHKQAAPPLMDLNEHRNLTATGIDKYK